MQRVNRTNKKCQRRINQPRGQIPAWQGSAGSLRFKRRSARSSARKFFPLCTSASAIGAYIKPTRSMGSNVFLVLVVFSGLAPLCFALTDVSSVPATSEHAWVTIFYEGTPRDYEYFLGARVALYSMWRRGSRQGMRGFSEQILK